MKLPFIHPNGFERLPGDRAVCYAAFNRDEMMELLDKKETIVCGTAARFLQVPETEVTQVIPVSNEVVSVFFAVKEHDLYEYGDEDNESTSTRRDGNSSDDVL